MPSKPSSVEERHIPDLIDKVVGEKNRLIIVHEGKELAAVVPLEDLEILEELDDLLERDDIEAARNEARETGTIPLEEVKDRLGL